MPASYRRKHTFDENCTIDANNAQSEWLIDVVEMLASYAQQNKLPVVEARLDDVIAVLRDELRGNRPLH